eukprot:11219998-Alexandrium_andersonii.AAC.1
MATSSAEGEALRLSAYQYTPASLVCAGDQWADASLVDVAREVREYVGIDQPSAAARRGWG